VTWTEECWSVTSSIDATLSRSLAVSPSPRAVLACAPIVAVQTNGGFDAAKNGPVEEYNKPAL
jgi:hypothetical protein